MMRHLLSILVWSLASTSLYAAPPPELTYQLKSSVVKVHVATRTGGHGVGTGVVVAKNLIATNCHVLANSRGVEVTKFGEGFAPVALKADWRHDVCLLRFEYLDLPAVTLGDSEQLTLEQAIFSIGFPGGPPKPLVTDGRIKALYAFDDSAIIRTDASFVMGASGSPLFDQSGKLIAISTFKSPGRTAYYYNVPVKWIRALLDAPETTSMQTDVAPFWDAQEAERPFFMRVVLPFQNEKWADLQQIAQLWSQQEPQSVEAFYYAGQAAEHLGQTEQAYQYYQQALHIRAQHPATLIALGLMANQAGNGVAVEETHTELKAINAELDETFNEALNPIQPETQ